MNLDTKNQLEIFQGAYSELEALLSTGPLQEIISDKVRYRALERLLGMLAVVAKRLQKLNPQWQIPELRTAIRAKNYILWDFKVLSQRQIRNYLQVFQKIHKYLKDQENTISHDAL